MASASGSDNDYRPAFMENADGQFHDTAAGFFHDEWKVETAMVVETPPPPTYTPPLPPPPNYCNYHPHYGPPAPVPFAQAMNAVDQYRGYGAFYHQEFPMVQLDAMTPNIPNTTMSSSALWAGMTASTRPPPSPPPRRRAVEPRPPKAPKKIKKEKKPLRLNPITGHPMPAVGKARQRRIAEGSTTSDGTRKKKKKTIPRDAEAERDALSRKENQCYQKGTVLVRHEDVNTSTYGQAVWVVDSYLLIQKYGLGNVDRDGTRRYYKTERFLGWLADDPAIYFPVNDFNYGDGDKEVMLVRSFPSQDDVTNYFLKMEVNRPKFPKLESESCADEASAETASYESESEEEEEYDYEGDVKQEPESDDDTKQEPESETEEGEIVD